MTVKQNYTEMNTGLAWIVELSWAELSWVCGNMGRLWWCSRWQCKPPAAYVYACVCERENITNIVKSFEWHHIQYSTEYSVYHKHYSMLNCYDAASHQKELPGTETQSRLLPTQTFWSIISSLTWRLQDKFPGAKTKFLKLAQKPDSSLESL